MYKNFNLTESEKVQILNQHKKYGYGKPLNEEMEDVNLGDRTSMDSESDWSNNDDDTYNEIKSIILDRHDGPVNDFVAISRAVKLAAKEQHYNNHQFTASDISNALYEALEQLKNAGGEFSSNEFKHLGY